MKFHSALVLIICLHLWPQVQAAPAHTPGPRCDVDFGREIPELAWQQRSDWLNVREAGARGDGKADDTAAIQKVLDSLGPAPGDHKVIYFPPGTYRITRTLVGTQLNGVMWVGHGRSTLLRWDGPEGGRMYWSNGISYSAYQGLVFDGAGKAAVGIDHDSKTFYETQVRHQYLEFRHFREAGIRVGHEQKVASAEMMFYDLVFRDNAAGVKFMAWNDYNNVFDGCLFERNGWGIHAEKGNIVVRNSRFDESRESDLFVSTHSHALRRIVSSNSNAFLRTVRGPASSGLIKMESVRIHGWKSTEGAVVADLRGPLLIVDTRFENAPSGARPPIKLNNPPYMNQVALLSNTSLDKGGAVIDAGLNGQVTEIPVKSAPLLPALAEQFVRTRVVVPEKIVDARLDCGARGDGRSNDTNALAQCLARLEQEGNANTLLYFPSGRFRISGGLTIERGKFRLGGTGWHSQLVRGGFSKGPVLRILDPEGLVLEQMAVAGTPGSVSIEQTGTRAGSIFYSGVYGQDTDQMAKQLIRISHPGPGTLTLSDQLSGRLELDDLGDSEVLLGFLASVRLKVTGESAGNRPPRLLFRVSALEEFPLEVTDNQSLTQIDWYNEQTPYLFRLQGAPDRQGLVVLDFSRSEARKPTFGHVEGYHGQLGLLGGLYGVPEDRFTPMLESGNSPNFRVAMFANAYWNEAPGITGAASEWVKGNVVISTGKDMLGLVGNHETDAAALATVVSSLEAIREAGRADRLYNGCRAP